MLPTWNAGTSANAGIMGKAKAAARRGLCGTDAASLPRFSKDPKTLLRKVVLYRGDITELNVDVIVNAANHSLLGGGGVDGAIHRKAGPQLRAFNRTLGGCKTSEVKASPAFQLACKQIFHTVGPRGEHPQALRMCYLNALELLKKANFRSIAFPCISTGVYGYPQLAAAQNVTDCVTKWLKVPANFESVDFIVFCVFERQDYIYYEQLLSKVKCRASVAISSVFAPRTVPTEESVASLSEATEGLVAEDVHDAAAPSIPAARAEDAGDSGDGDEESERPCRMQSAGAGGEQAPWGGSWVLCGGGEDATREEEDGTGDDADDKTRVFEYRGNQEGMELQPLKSALVKEASGESSPTSPERSSDGKNEGDGGDWRARRQSMDAAGEGGERHKRRASVDEEEEDDEHDDYVTEHERRAVRLVERKEDADGRRRKNERKDRREKKDRQKKETARRRVSEAFVRHVQERVDAEQRVRLRVVSPDFPVAERAPDAAAVPDAEGQLSTLPPAQDEIAVSVNREASAYPQKPQEPKESASQSLDDDKSAAVFPAATPAEPSDEPSPAAREDSLRGAKNGKRQKGKPALAESSLGAPLPPVVSSQASALLQEPSSSVQETVGTEAVSAESSARAQDFPAKRVTPTGKTNPHTAGSEEARSPQAMKSERNRRRRRNSASSQGSPGMLLTPSQNAEKGCTERKAAHRKQADLESGNAPHCPMDALDLPPVDPLSDSPHAGLARVNQEMRDPDAAEKLGRLQQSQAADLGDVASAANAPASAAAEARHSKRQFSSVSLRQSDDSGGAAAARNQRHKKFDKKEQKQRHS
ncbi:macro domain-containing protein [Besnoitia besnoiti]|uniref:Macro domain-containing protein n=1 Tax=Besnoitia besnoiti TaxID=94643 RepID=A0A2A9M355_BESBE|nr:macro domain-containing protein [Besnoitia besnoiti]PFH32369.1 macro domain-containing protein [Besnoitia besnoiti]